MGERNLKLVLQKAFIDVQQVYKALTLISKECESPISSLANLVEQYECCRKICDTDIPFNAICPDLKDKLIGKILAELAESRNSLQSKMDCYKDSHSKVCHQYHNVMNLYKKNLDITIDTVTNSSTVYPPLAEMMEYLSDIELLLFQEYECKKLILDEILMSDTITSDNLVNLWFTDEKVTMEKIKDCLCFLTFFMEEKI